MTTSTDLLRTIVSDPTNTDVRLMYADLLDEEGDYKRAEFIRVQCELAQRFDLMQDHKYKARPACACKYCQLRKREGLLMIGDSKTGHYNCTKWIGGGYEHRCTVQRDGGPFGPIGWDINVMYINGFIEHVACSLSLWKKYGADIVTRHPVNSVLISDRYPYSQRRERCVWFHPNVPRDDKHATLPVELFDMIKGDKGSVPMRKWFNNLLDAMEALEFVCICWARKQAGLPILHRTGG